MGIPGVDDEEAREAGLWFARHVRKTVGKPEDYVSDAVQKAGAEQLEGLLNVCLGSPVYRRPLPGSEDEPGDILANQIMDLLALPEGLGKDSPYTLEPMEVAAIARGCSPLWGLRSLKRASTDLLKDAALLARYMVWASGSKQTDRPYVTVYLSAWMFCVTALTWSPVARLASGCLRVFSLDTLNSLKNDPEVTAKAATVTNTFDPKEIESLGRTVAERLTAAPS
jgi:hypothetical protein